MVEIFKEARSLGPTAAELLLKDNGLHLVEVSIWFLDIIFGSLYKPYLRTVFGECVDHLPIVHTPMISYMLLTLENGENISGPYFSKV